MIPVLFPHDATSFITHGIGDLMETIKCESIVNSEGEYELELQYPSDGQLIGSLTYNNIIVAKVNDHGNNQAFRIYGVDKAINGLVTVRAQHISYDLSCVVVQNYEATVCRLAMLGLKSHAIGSLASPFGFTTDIPDTERPQNQDHKFKMLEPKTLRSALLDGDDSIYGCWEGDLVFDNYTVKFLKPGSTDVDAGKDRGVLIEYGIDMIDMQEEQSISEMITGVYPYWKGREEAEEGDQGTQEEFFVYGDIQYASGTFTRHRVIPLNVTEYFVNDAKAPTKAQINAKAQEWMTANKVGEPVINLTVSYAELGKDVRLYDAVTVRFVKIGIDYGAKVISYKYDVLKERCIEVEVGNVKPSIFFKLEDASRLKRGLIPPTRIANKSIDTEKIATGSIGSPQIASHGISSANIADEAVIRRSIEDYAVNVDKIADSAITESKIDTGAVTESKISDSAVTEDKIADDAVTTDKVNNWAITTDKIGDMVVTSAKIQNGACTNEKIGNAAITATKISNGAVVEAKIGNSAITSVKIKDGEVVTAKIADSAITTKKVKDLAIDSAKIGNSAITSAKIKNGEVVSAKIANAAITTDKVADLAIDSAKIGNSAITSVKIQNGSVVNGKIGNQAIDFRTIKDAEIDQLSLNDYSVTSTKISDPGWRYHWQRNSDGSVTKGWVYDESAVETDAIADDAVVSTKIGDQEISTTHFDTELNQWIVDVDGAVWLVVNTLSWSEATGSFLQVDQLIAGYEGAGIYAGGMGTVVNGSINLGSTISAFGSWVGTAPVPDEVGDTVYALVLNT